MKLYIDETILFLLTLLITSVNFAQEESTPLNKQFKLSYTFLGLGADYEFPLNKKITLEVGLGLGAGNYIRKTVLNSNEFGPSISVDAFPPLRFKSRLKYIYNRDKRLKKNKSIVNNSGNYLAFQTLFTTGQNVTNIKTPPNNSLLTEVQWGLQRSLGGNWLFNFYAGVGFARDFETKLGKIYPALGLEFSYILF